MGKVIDISNKKFGILTVISFSHTTKKVAFWRCKCDCGAYVVVAGRHLRSGHTTSCGCLGKKRRAEANTKHGKYRTRLYSIWRAMLQRTTNSKCYEFKNYGARGIKVCDDWRNFLRFAEWSLNSGYDDTLFIDRIDTNKGYNPQNCRWATMKQQQRNRRNNRVVVYKGEKRCLSEWAEHLGFTHKVLSYRLDKGWPISKAFTEPVKQKGARPCG